MSPNGNCKVVWRFTNLFKGDAQKCYEEMKSIGESWTPEDVLDKARDRTTELHKCFVWDDSLAAEKYRLFQARQIVASIVFKSDPNRDDAPKNIRVIQSVLTQEKRTSYKPVQTIVRNQSEYESLLKKAITELESFRNRYRNIVELESVLRAIDGL